MVQVEYSILHVTMEVKTSLVTYTRLRPTARKRGRCRFQPYGCGALKRDETQQLHVRLSRRLIIHS